jgi:hypothetical protein
LHANFRLAREGEEIGLYRSDSASDAVADTMSFGFQQADAAFGRMPDGGAAWQVVRATPGFATRPTSVGESRDATPLRFELEAPYPNPFNPMTSIRFTVPASSAGRQGSGVVSLMIFDVLGQEVATLVNDIREPGEHNVQWNAENVSSGVYIVRLTVRASNGIQGEERLASQSVLLLK